MRPSQIVSRILVLRDDAVTVADEERQKVEDLRLDVHDLALPPQLLAARVELVSGEHQRHCGLPSTIKAVLASAPCAHRPV
jgi:hypothetical protein